MYIYAPIPVRVGLLPVPNSFHLLAVVACVPISPRSWTLGSTKAPPLSSTSDPGPAADFSLWIGGDTKRGPGGEELGKKESSICTASFCGLLVEGSNLDIAGQDDGISSGRLGSVTG